MLGVTGDDAVTFLLGVVAHVVDGHVGVGPVGRGVLQEQAHDFGHAQQWREGDPHDALGGVGAGARGLGDLLLGLLHDLVLLGGEFAARLHLERGLRLAVAESAITVDPFTIPDHWPRIAGVDFGIDHPSAGAWIAWDRDTDTTYVYDGYRESNKTPADLVPLIKQRGDWVPVSWPADGLQRSKGDGIQLADLYRQHGANMLHEYAQLPETGDEEGKKTSRVSVEAGVMAIYEDMKAGKFKVFSSLTMFFEEFRLYHRKDGQIVKLQDDFLSATRYAYVMRRYAEVPPDPGKSAMNPRRDFDWRAG